MGRGWQPRSANEKTPILRSFPRLPNKASDARDDPLWGWYWTEVQHQITPLLEPSWVVPVRRSKMANDASTDHAQVNMFIFMHYVYPLDCHMAIPTYHIYYIWHQAYLHTCPERL